MHSRLVCAWLIGAFLGGCRAREETAAKDNVQRTQEVRRQLERSSPEDAARIARDLIQECAARDALRKDAVTIDSPCSILEHLLVSAGDRVVLALLDGELDQLVPEHVARHSIETALKSTNPSIRAQLHRMLARYAPQDTLSYFVRRLRSANGPGDLEATREYFMDASERDIEAHLLASMENAGWMQEQDKLWVLDTVDAALPLEIPDLAAKIEKLRLGSIGSRVDERVTLVIEDIKRMSGLSEDQQLQILWSRGPYPYAMMSRRRIACRSRAVLARLRQEAASDSPVSPAIRRAAARALKERESVCGPESGANDPQRRTEVGAPMPIK